MKNILVLVPFEEEKKESLQKKFQDQNFTFSDYKTVSLEEVLNADGIIGNAPIEFVKKSKNLKWMQLMSAGYEGYLVEGILNENVVLNSAVGAYGISVGEHMFSMTISMLKRIPQYRDNQNCCHWNNFEKATKLSGLNVLVVGLGDIGSHYGKLMCGLGNTIVGIKNNLSSKPDFVNEVYSLKDLDKVVGKADIVALSLPLNEDTKWIFNKEMFLKMKKEALIFNVGRGSLINTEDLIFALENDIISGAGIDVTEIEPLPKGDKLWNTKNLLITPHCAGGINKEGVIDTIYDLAIHNLSTYINGGTYKNKVNG